MWSSCAYIWMGCFCLVTIVTLIMTNNESDILWEYITRGWFYIQACNSLTSFQKIYFCNVSLEILCIDTSKIWLQQETWFWAQLTILYIERIEQENKVEYNFTEYVHNFLMSDFQSNFDRSFSGLLTILINKKFCRRVILLI